MIVIHVPMAKREQTEETINMALIEKLVLLELDMETLHSYRNRHRSFKLTHPWANLSDEEYLLKIGAVIKGNKEGNLTQEIKLL